MNSDLSHHATGVFTDEISRESSVKMVDVSKAISRDGLPSREFISKFLYKGTTPTMKTRSSKGLRRQASSYGLEQRYFAIRSKVQFRLDDADTGPLSKALRFLLLSFIWFTPTSSFY
ncbi:hypothetical protein B9Z19DRAFT_1068647 [Tuber borchii]|uniref:Uncharacterized protein n=1 Tax=Tuber borchii TaxID=42251 RepID=A0A2T6ZEG5_TUBBO|nr:hypothetical protein B9Z19DRAFT_1068647 [Tuber borchii]